ncbi:MAG: hypothetical protein ABIW82_06650 [Dokdonella sp.]
MADIAESNQVVAGEGPYRPFANGTQPTRDTAQSSDRLDPAKTLLDGFTHLLAHRVPVAAHTASVDRAALAVDVAGDVRDGCDPV